MVTHGRSRGQVLSVYLLYIIKINRVLDVPDMLGFIALLRLTLQNTQIVCVVLVGVQNSMIRTLYFLLSASARKLNYSQLRGICLASAVTLLARIAMRR